ncbi:MULTISPECIES: SRPBCC family protein [Peribacillus]|uniref:SRPBCC family protein n=1 Tax=Peribacillus TaxID=2675229 RepID=UPI001F4D36EE|nr:MULTISPECIES: SRPBCC domain-containing protein [unclassified Peribacillus]MCK1985777.1 SRPBCC domain-containing protein [Peribacillus sp. Aquil_B1]MCK2010703.1 SRPBCC domain-containing protein [Peribacillus sp. Aquil_B8]
MEKYSTTTLKMIRNFDVVPEMVFDAWLTPEMMRKWLFTLEGTNKVAQNDPQVGGTWEIIDHRDGKDYRAIGEYLEMDPPNKLVFTFKMPQFSESVDTIIIELKKLQKGCEMTFSQKIIVPHEENWTESDIEKALGEFHDGSEHGWNLMFMGLKELVETGQVSYKG